MSITVATIACAVIYLIVTPSWYRSSVTLAPASSSEYPSLPSALGGLASIAGVTGLNSGGNLQESVGVLRSRSFAGEFISEYNVLPILFADDWDANEQSWLVEQDDVPDIRDGIEYFHEEVFSLSEDARTGLLTLYIDWTDPDLSANWANSLVSRINSQMRDRAIVESSRNIKYMEETLGQTNVAPLRASISSIIETEMQRLMVAKGKDEFAFTIIDEAQVPKKRHHPRRGLTLILSAILGAMLGALVAISIRMLRPQ